ncbi:PQ loop repeat protein [Variibacter gotjawalensis]|uniref:PQ loop repeat protein n=1 Tax=Variibacter gotjawalensis TaxID=1333996 RepID=A0A0S3PYG5_9BRAD|nr:SemiSWEET transporter [Variibacter gotjawalensis]NIK46803.1 MtN3 and saliva related transmembrane protein [Variibacter gotjawalensis]RZS48707.1 MtN3 and saliva related transmembrane protein [Variibacter gotjawalensis]BAT60966.1 PQ loop repeat protein [Variibacter gotjawalensis]
MPFDLTTIIGVLAAICTTASYFPQLKKSWESGETGDLSLKMILFLMAGLGLWVVYGVLRTDAVIIIANCISLACLSVILTLKLRER